MHWQLIRRHLHRPEHGRPPPRHHSCIACMFTATTATTALNATQALHTFETQQLTNLCHQSQSLRREGTLNQAYA
eukprot:366313-Chlamydomonas_euryale.AAC.15